MIIPRFVVVFIQNEPQNVEQGISKCFILLLLFEISCSIFDIFFSAYKNPKEQTLESLNPLHQITDG